MSEDHTLRPDGVCFTCGGSTYDILGPYLIPRCDYWLDCGGFCPLAKGHVPPHVCVGDTDGLESCGHYSTNDLRTSYTETP